MSRTDERADLREADGTFNLRDVGGLPAADGLSVRPGSLFRSGDLGRLTSAGAERLRALGVALVVDLRTTAEIERRGRYPFEGHGIEYRHVPLMEARTIEPESVPRELPPDILFQLLRRFAEDGGERLGEVLRLLASEPATPALVHCVAGKDRTGAVVGVALSLAGVPDDAIAADYARSEAALVALREGRDDDLVRWLAAVPPQVLEAKPGAMLAFLAWLRERHGTVEAFAGSIGASAATVAALRARLLEPARPS
jgi:protein tyrosine/serine phosphatase